MGRSTKNIVEDLLSSQEKRVRNAEARNAERQLIEARCAMRSLPPHSIFFGAIMPGATSLIELILKKWGDDIAGAAKELEEKVGFPESVANRIATGELPMDAESVAKRAQDQGMTYLAGGITAQMTILVSLTQRGLALHTA